MRALAPPASARRARAAAVQPASQAPSSAVMKRGGAKVGAADSKWLAAYQDWQGWARRYARQLSVVRFSVGLPASVASRCGFRIEEQNPDGDWDETQDPRLLRAMDDYRNARQAPSELIRMHFRHYEVAGEMVQVITDRPGGGIDWWIFSVAALEWDRPTKGFVTVKLTPAGQVSDETAFVVPRDNVVRFWTPDEEWQAYATSDMVGVIDDLHRYRAMAHYAQSTAESAAAMSGLLWTPSEAHEDNRAQEQEATDDASEPISPLEEAYYQLARRRFDPTDDDITAIIPPMVRWDNALKPPEFVKLVEALDPNGIAYRREALEDVARGFPLPSSLVLGGGPGGSNHWTEWLVDRKFFDNAVAPTLDQVCHADLTTTFLPVVLAVNGIPNDGRRRIGYDPTPVIVKEDKSDLSLRYFLAGLLKGETALEEGGFDPNDRMGAQELEMLIELLAKRGPEQIQLGPPGGAPVDQSNATEEIPAAPTELIAAQAALARAAAVEGPTTVGDPTLDPAPSQARVDRLLAQLARARANLGRELLAAAEHAFATAVERAGSKVLARSRSRAAKSTDSIVVAAVRDGSPLRPLLAAVGVRESDLLHESFATFEELATTKLERARVRQRAAIARAGFDPDEFLGAEADDSSSRGAAAVLAGSLLALAFTRLMDGTPGAPGSTAVPAAPGEVTGSVPAKVVTDAIAVAEGSARATLGDVGSAAPMVQRLGDVAPLERRLADRALQAVREARADNLERLLSSGQVERPQVDEVLAADGELGPVYVWRWGFYGDPTTPFEPHQDLGASEFTTTDPTGDPALVNPNPWPEQELYQPGDHDGCTCEWEIVMPDGGSMAQLRLDAPEEP